jgi:hypothetical protein
MVDGIPEHLLVLRGSDAIELGEAIEAVRLVVGKWKAGDKTSWIGNVQSLGNWNPLSIVRKHLAKLPDEAGGANSQALDFIQDDDLRESLAADIRSIEEGLDRGAWKAVTILAGAVTEALLLDTLLCRKDDAIREGSGLPKPAPKNLADWSLHHLTEVAAALAVVETETASQCRIAKNFRNLIHPGRTLRLEQTCDRGTALATFAAVELVIRDLRRKAGYHAVD